MTWWCCSADYPNHEPTCKNYELAESSTQQAPEPRTDIDAVSRDVVKLMKDYGYVYSFEHNDINHLANQIVRLVRRQS